MKFLIPFRLLLTLLVIHLSIIRSIAAESFVEISPRGLSPSFQQILVGDTVTWVNFTSLDYTIISLDGAWSAISLPSLTSASQVFTIAGTYQYYAESTTFFGAFGIIEVLESWPPPNNDQCDGAIPMSHFGTYIMSTAHATSTNEPATLCNQPVGNGVWYSYTANQSGTVTISTCGSTYDTVIGVYTASCESFSHLPPLPIACNNNDGVDCEGTQASVTFYAYSGFIYKIFVGGRNGQTGTLRISASEPIPLPPHNDKCTGAIPMVNRFIHTMDTSFATTTGDPVPMCQPLFGKGVWYSFTPSMSGEVAISTIGSDFDTVLSIYTGNCNSLSPVLEGCNDNHDTSRSLVVFTAEAFTTYYILVGGYNSEGGNLHIQAWEQYGVPPVNDQCHNAIALIPDITYEVNTTFATETGDRTATCGAQLGKGVWYTYMSRTGGAVTITTCGSSFDTILSLFEGFCNFSQAAIACNDDDGLACSGENASLRFVAKPLVYYTILVGGAYGQAGDLKISASAPVPIPPPPNDACSGAVPLVSGVPYRMSIEFATSNEITTDGCDFPITKGVWFTYTPELNGTATFTTCGSDYRTHLAIMTGSCDALTIVTGACPGASACSEIAADLTIKVTANQTYWIFVASLEEESGNLQIEVNGPKSGWKEVATTFDVSGALSQPQSNVVHMVDATNRRLLSLDTTSGSIISSIRLPGEMHTNGLMALSFDGQYLYVPLYQQQKLQIISLKDSSTWDMVSLTNMVESLAYSADKKLYAKAGPTISKIDPITGLQSVAASSIGATPKLIRSNPTGTRLFVMDIEAFTTTPAIHEYVIGTSSPMTYVTNHNLSQPDARDFVIASDINTIYSTGLKVDGVEVWNMASRNRKLWPYNFSGGTAVTINRTFIYGASADAAATVVRSFDRFSGEVHATYALKDMAYPAGRLIYRSLQATDNGHIFYARSGRRIGLIGATSLRTNLPPTKEWIDAGTNLMAIATVPFTLQADAPSPAAAETYVWSKIEGPGIVQFSTPTNLSTTAAISMPGQYTLQVSRVNGSLISRDRLLVTVAANPIRILQTSVDIKGDFNLLFEAPATGYVVEASTNLVDWETIAHAFNAEGQYTVQDSITNRTQRFYRIRRVVE